MILIVFSILDYLNLLYPWFIINLLSFPVYPTTPIIHAVLETLDPLSSSYLGSKVIVLIVDPSHILAVPSTGKISLST